MPRAALFRWPLHGTRSHFSLESEGVSQSVTVAFSLMVSWLPHSFALFIKSVLLAKTLVL